MGSNVYDIAVARETSNDVHPNCLVQSNEYCHVGTAAVGPLSALARHLVIERNLRRHLEENRRRQEEISNERREQMHTINSHRDNVGSLGSMNPAIAESVRRTQLRYSSVCREEQAELDSRERKLKARELERTLEWICLRWRPHDV